MRILFLIVKKTQFASIVENVKLRWLLQLLSKSYTLIVGMLRQFYVFPLICYQTNDAMLWSHSNNEFYTVKSSYYVAKIIAIKENLI